MTNDEMIKSFIPSELQQKTTAPIPLDAREDKNYQAAPLHPMLAFDIRSPEEIKKQVEIAKNTANFFKNHWTWFYVAAAIGMYRAYTASRVNAAIFRIDKKLREK